MKKIKKLIVAILAMAMVIGCFAVQASADVKDCTSTNDWKVMGAFNEWAEESMTAVGDGRYYFNIDIAEAGDYQFLITGTVEEAKTYFKDKDDKYSNNFNFTADAAGTYQIVVDPAAISEADVYWGGTYYTNVGVSAGKAVTANDCKNAIAAIGTVELSATSYDKIKAAKTTVSGYLGSTSNIENYADLAAAETAYAKLVKDAAGTIILHVKTPDTWSQVNVHTFGGDYLAVAVQGEPGWPGAKLNAEAKNSGWNTIALTTTAATNMLFTDNGITDDRKTANIYLVGAGEYWYTIAADNSYTVSKEAPAGWVSTSDAEAAANAEALIDKAIALEATKANKEAYDAATTAYKALTADQKKLVDATKVTKLEEGVAAIEDIIAKEQAAEDAKNAGTLTVYVKSPGWTAMNVYGWDGAEFGDWPGKSLTALKVNEGWFSVSFDITKATNLIFNDNKTNNEQTVNWEGVKAGTYWLVLSEKDGEGKYLVDALSTTAPEGWKEEAAEKVEQELPTSIKTVTEEEISAMKDAVKVEGSNDKLVVAPLDAASKDVAVLTTALAKELKGVKFIAADLKFESGKQPAEGTKITIDISKLAEVKSAKYVTVYSVKDSKLEKVETVEVKDGKITFAPKHFSTYVFAEATNINEGPLGVPAAVVVASVSLMLAAVVAVIASKKRVTE